MESSAVVQRTRAGSAETTVEISDPSARKASTGVHFPFGPSIQSVAGSAYVTEPTDASTILRPVSRATGGAGARPSSNALTCSTPGSAASAG
jgi:hypothetical protein